LEVRRFFHFLKGNSFALVYFEASFDEVFELVTDVLPEIFIPDVLADVGLQIFIVFAAEEWLLGVQKFIQNYSECPDICFGTVLVLQIAFGGHVERGADAEVDEGLAA
jgi:hypothetical protein